MKKIRKTKGSPVNRCAICGSETKVGEITHYLMRNNEAYVIKNVPAFICSSDWCGNEWVEQTTLEAVDRLILDEPLYVTKARVYNFRTLGGIVASPWSLGEKKHEQDSRVAK